MKTMLKRMFVAATTVAMLAGCNRSSAPPPLLGTLEWDRIAVPAEASEPITQMLVKEGDLVEAHQLLLTLDPRRTQAQLDAARADEQRQSAALDELRHGARIETIDASRAALSRAQATAANARLVRDRALRSVKAQAQPQADLDNANAALRQADADASAAQANLAELLHGTRPEDLAQGEAALAQAQATVAQLSVTLERLSVRAPRAGRVDTLPFKLGDRPPQGAGVVSFLVGDAPYARVFVPETQRVGIAQGARFSVKVQGIDHAFSATALRIASEASFTPYYALTGDDASRLVYRAELGLDGDDARKLPAGLPCQAVPAAAK
jgi:HlyD family secretion protein